MPWFIIGGLAGTIVLNLFVGFKAYGAGQEAERAIWQDANVETLIGSNTSLSQHIEAINASHKEHVARDITTGNKIQTVETRIIERIKEVPVEKYIKVAGDCRLDYDIIGVRNDWAKGDSDRPANTGEAGAYISRDGTKTLSGDFISDPP